VNADSMAQVAKALAHPARVRILRLLAEENECRGADLFAELPGAQSTISEHLRVLKDSGLVTSHPVGNGMVYCVVNCRLEEFRAALGGLQSEADCSRVKNND